jgi:hypothetical protein
VWRRPEASGRRFFFSGPSVTLSVDEATVQNVAQKETRSQGIGLEHQPDQIRMAGSPGVRKP